MIFFCLGFPCVLLCNDSWLVLSNLQIKDMLQKLDETLKSKDRDRKAFKEKHGIMTQDERNAMMKRRSAN